MPFKKSLSRGQILLRIVHQAPDHPLNRFADRIEKLVVNTKTSGGAKNGKRGTTCEEYSLRVYYKEGAAPERTSATIDAFDERYDLFVVSLKDMVAYTTGAGACRNVSRGVAE